MDSRKIERLAQKLHSEWLKGHQDYIDACNKNPRIYMQSHDFARIVEWKKLPKRWKEQYRRDARYSLLNQ